MKALSLDLTCQWEGSHQEVLRKGMSDRIQGGLVKYRRARQPPHPPASSVIPQWNTGHGREAACVCPAAHESVGEATVGHDDGVALTIEVPGNELLGPLQGVRRGFLEEETLALSLDKEGGSSPSRQRDHRGTKAGTRTPGPLPRRDHTG